MSVLTIAELDQGIEALAIDDPLRKVYAAFRDGVEATFQSRMLPLATEIVRLWGSLRGRRVAAGLGKAAPIDSLLAATSVHHRLYFATRNTSDVNGLAAVVFNPWTDDPASFPLSR